MATRKTSAADTTSRGTATTPIRKTARAASETAKPADKARETEESPEERVYRTLYDGILDRRLAPGTKLKEIPLAQAFGVTRGVVRKTLARLATAKVVTLRSQHGASVASPSLEEVGQIFAARRLVEGFVIERLAESIDASQLKTLRELMKQERDTYRAGDMRTGIKLSTDFHVQLAQCAGNTVLTEFLQQLVARTPLIFLAHGDPGKSVSCSDQEHANIIAAVIAGDTERAVKAMRAHLDHLESHVVPAERAKPLDLAQLLGL